jgi:hypothetical protein
MFELFELEHLPFPFQATGELFALDRSTAPLNRP